MFHFITMLRILQQGIKQRCDVFHCHEPGSLLICAIIKIIKRNKIVYDAHEHYPSLIAEDAMFPSNTKSIIEFIVDKCERILCRFADSIITVNKTLKDRFDNLKKTTIIFNVPSLQNFPLKNKEKTEYEIVYAGNVNKKRGLDKLIHSMKILKDHDLPVKLLIVGNVSDTKEFNLWMDQYLKKNNMIENFKITGWVPHDEVVEHIRMSSGGIILFQPTYYNNIIGLPNKLFEYMACKVPVIASNFPEISSVIKETKSGLLVDPTDISEIANAIKWLFENPEEGKKMGISGRCAVEETYNWEHMEKRLLKLYEELA